MSTDRFSLWGIGWWDVESAISTTVTKARNLLSTDGVPGIGKRVANPPTVECAYPALTLTLDVEKFVPGAITCAKFDVTDGSRRTLDLYVSNPHFTPFLLDLPPGVRSVEAKPDPDNPYMLLARTMASAQNLPVAFLPAVGMIRLKVDLSKLTGTAVSERTRRKDTTEVTFVLPPGHPAGETGVVGDFNDRQPGIHPFVLRIDGSRAVAVTLPANRRVAFRYLAHGDHRFDEHDAGGHGGHDGYLDHLNARALTREQPPADVSRTPAGVVAAGGEAVRRAAVREAEATTARRHATALVGALLTHALSIGLNTQ
ncbi:hypothetical protein [Embleya sp. NPDC050493]|uniref:hypothetical protein n=1 Tax=Embleya sp. NPDC050493 TaxID=3363989 RepID=UPI0037B307C3